MVWFAGFFLSTCTYSSNQEQKTRHYIGSERITEKREFSFSHSLWHIFSSHRVPISFQLTEITHLQMFTMGLVGTWSTGSYTSI